MADSPVFAEMKSYVGFTADDATRLANLAPLVESHLPDVATRFYEEIRRHPRAFAIFRDEHQLDRLRRTLQVWIGSLFGGVYDEQYYETHAHVGRVHVQVGLPQHYMHLAMEVIWQELHRVITAARPAAEAAADLASLHKLITIETAIMLESYKASYAAQVRQIEREAVQDELSRAEQLAHVGQLAASLAHEIKNPLAGISGAIQVIRGGMDDAHPHYPILSEILRQISRLDHTVKDLLVYSRPKQPKLKTVDLNQVVARVLTLLHEEPKLQKVCVDFRHNGEAFAEADDIQLEQVLINLMLNAADASRPQQPVRIEVHDRGAEVEISVSDEGCGMPAHVLQRAFEPFFTSKAKGTGLGLPICRKIVEAHGGQIRVDSQERVGTTVILRLPKQQPPPRP